MMAPLPASRVTPSRAFGRTGVDYAGPFSVLASKGRGIRTTKGYIAVFVCMTTKALHLELVGDLSTAAFLGALARFTVRRGRPSELWSDNATCFCRADLELREALQVAEIDWDLVAGSLASQGIAWHFIPPGAPHFGGLWEAAVKSVKGHLRHVMGSRHLTYEEFSTVLVGIEMVLNGRPLTPLSGDSSDLERLKWSVARRSFAVGDFVMLLDATLLQSSGRWPLGRIIRAQPGPDGLVRAVTVKTATGEYVRPIVKLALFPVANPGPPTPPPDGQESRPALAGGD
ncbi:uncharacterized protein LOC106638550 [Copidosoma floridanum]|uniref:uncharacterized protein LOC106638550 n=1 Tax=Copidosoma floridanum TaxID=29053 RepID=UPI0006C95240|nr:uncharacterized protein LOC106638550 [Copidosoma floridanum]